MKSRSLSLFFISLLVTGSLSAALPIMFEPMALDGVNEGPTPLYVSKQIYLERAPKGVGAKAAWEIAGGKGENVRIIDIESGTNKEHEDFPSLIADVVPHKGDNHGTAVMGVMGAVENGFGVTGIANRAEMGFIGFAEGYLAKVNREYIDGINKAIKDSVALLRAGDVMVIEQHMEGPDRGKYTAVEYWPEIFRELKKATDKGIHCIAAAGNGSSDFDSKKYKGAFDLKVRDSGCVIVGAGGVRNKKPLYFTNYGSRVDAFGYGERVTTTGYGDLFKSSTNAMYTKRFNGTSSATPIVAGAVAVVSSIAKAQGRVITPLEMRAALRATGTPQKSSSKRIGNLPDILALLGHFNLLKE